MQPRVTPLRLFGLALLSCLVAAMLGAQPLADWVDASIVSDTVVQQAADEWLVLMQHIGLDRPYDVLRHAIRKAEGPH